jgi:hypothetical protein
MKKLYTLSFSLLLIINLATAQAPQGFKYQASVRDNNGIALLNKLVAIKISLLAGTANGTSVYSEVHNVVTSDFGIVNLNIGNGTVSSGNFTTIDWGSNTYFIKTEVDINNGTNFLFMGTSQLLSVPYAMFAAKSGNAANDKDQDSLNEIQNINLNGNNLQLNKNGGSVDLTKYAIDNNTDSQTINLIGNTLSISRGNSIVLSGAVDLDADPTNEIQNLSLNKDTLKLSKANYIVLPKDNDADSTNEIQSLSVNQNKLTISKSNQVTIDADTTNEIQSLTYYNDILQLSKSNQVVFPRDNDRDSLNEIQTIIQVGNTITLNKNGGNVSVPSTNNVQNGSLLFANATGTNSISLTLNPTPTSYFTGMVINFKVPNNNTGHVTVNLNGLGNKALFKNYNDTLVGNDLQTNKLTSIIYDGQNFQLLNQIYSPEYAYYSQVGSYLSPMKPLVTSSWTKVSFNTTNIQEGKSMNKVSDSILLKPGVYKIKGSVAVNLYRYASGTVGSFTTRFRNLSQNNTVILGKNVLNTTTNIDNTSFTENRWSDIEGIVVVNNLEYFSLQCFLYRYGNGAYVNDIGIDNVFSSGQPDLQSYLIIERVR